MRYLTALIVVLSLIIGATPALAQTSDELAAIKRDVEALKSGLATLQNELRAIRSYLQQTRQGGAGAAPENVEVSLDSAVSKGADTAPLTIVEFSDFQCPYCGRYARETFAQLDQNYVATGKLRYVVRNLPLEQIHPDAFRAAEAAECAGAQGKYWEMHERLFANQQALGAEALTKHAEAVGLDMAAFRQCVDSGARAEKIRKDIADAQKAGISGTPTFLFGKTEPGQTSMKVIGRVVGAHPYASFKSAIDGLLAAGEPSKTAEPSK